jgi:hypothetical protein
MSARTRPVFKTAALDDQEKFKPVPPPSGQYPYHLDIKTIIPTLPENKMVFHMAGDTGGLVFPEVKHRVANEMILQCEEIEKDEDRPKFFFHLGDVVYNYGQEEQYYPQFFEPYREYPGKVFAIAGNHDADLDPFDTRPRPSLEAFLQVFCDTEARQIPFAGDTGRLSNIQPNIYWSLKTPLANIIALYSNVPRFGAVTPQQRDWLIQELNAAKTDHRALIICLHHSAYSADTNHGSSIHMQQLLNGAFAETGVYPTAVFSGHVHNYQRFTKRYSSGKTVPFIISGAGGYADLHKIAQPGDPAFPDDSALLDDAQLKKYCDTAHGFLKISLEKTAGGINMAVEYYILDLLSVNKTGTKLFDRLELVVGD